MESQLQPSAPNKPATLVYSIAADIILTLVTCGIYNLFIQHRQMKIVNFLLGKDKYSFGMWALLCLVTCGIYHVYHEYVMTQDICKSVNKSNSNEPVICLILSVFGFTIVADAIQQHMINEHFGRDSVV